MTSKDFQASESLRIAVLAGGESSERSISIESGAAVTQALAERGHHVATIDPLDVDLTAVDWDEFDAAFVALHGRFGEDGQVQRLLDAAGVPYTGSDADVSQLAFSKSASKERFLQCGVPTPPYVLIHETDDAARIEMQARKLGFPLVVKPDAQGSSLGVSIVESPEDLSVALAGCFHYEAFGLLEAAIPGTEWTASMLDDRLLPLILIDTARPFYDFQAKYEDDETAYRLDFDLPPSVVESIETAGRQACKAVGTSGLARVDIRVDKYGRPWVLEVNTIPGLTGHSLVPKSAAHTGISLGELCEQAVVSCLKAHRECHSRNVERISKPQ